MLQKLQHFAASRLDFVCLYWKTQLTLKLQVFGFNSLPLTFELLTFGNPSSRNMQLLNFGNTATTY
jgi:hypothetical protein